MKPFQSNLVFWICLGLICISFQCTDNHSLHSTIYILYMLCKPAQCVNTLSSITTILNGLTHNHNLSKFFAKNDHICYFKTNLNFANNIVPSEDSLQHLFICIVPLEHRRKRHSLELLRQLTDKFTTKRPTHTSALTNLQEQTIWMGSFMLDF